MSYTKQFGQRGEQIAAEFLIERNHTIIDRNVFLRYAEIDIISQRNDTIYFWEVKTRSQVGGQHSHGLPQESVSYAKKRKLIISGQYYVHKHPELKWNKLKLGVIAVAYDGNHNLFSIKTYLDDGS